MKRMKRMTLLAICLLAILSCSQNEEYVTNENLEEVEEETPTPEDENDEDSNINPPETQTELKAFPSAFGAGAYVTGGRGGVVIPVTRLDDELDANGDPLEGTLRYALTRQFPRIIVFRVSGEIKLIHGKGGIFLERGASNKVYGDFTVAGQTAPEGGVTIVGNIYMDGVENMIWRYVRIRKDDHFDGFDCMTAGNCRRIVFDHLSLSYGSDEGLSVSNGVRADFPSSEVTIQNCFMAHNKTGNILGTISTPEFGGQISYINNFTTNTSHRFPNTAADGDYEVINNLVYNWTYRLVNVIDAPKLNHINNAYVAGPRTVYYAGEDYSKISNKINMAIDRTINAQIYTAGNYITNLLTDPEADNWFTWTIFVTDNGYKSSDPAPKEIQVNTPHPLLGAPIEIRTAQEIMNDLPREVGAFKTLNENGEVIVYRDDLDAQWINEYVQDNGPLYSFSSEPYEYPTIPSNAAYTDTDKDGMPDKWEIANGFDPNVQDHNEDIDGDGYTNLESFLNLVDSK